MRDVHLPTKFVMMNFKSFILASFDMPTNAMYFNIRNLSIDPCRKYLKQKDPRMFTDHYAYFLPLLFPHLLRLFVKVGAFAPISLSISTIEIAKLMF